jgi:glutathione peroxidase
MAILIAKPQWGSNGCLGKGGKLMKYVRVICMVCTIAIGAETLFAQGLSAAAESFYGFSFLDTSGRSVSLADYRGKVVLIVNTATRCGLAGQFEGLELLNQEYRDQGLVIIGFPCNQFLGQEPEGNETVAEYCSLNWGVSFLLAAQVEVNGPNTHPLFSFLKKALPDEGLFNRQAIKWNFTKFLIDSNGRPVKRFAPAVLPKELEGDIVKLLAPM